MQTIIYENNQTEVYEMHFTVIVCNPSIAN